MDSAKPPSFPSLLARIACTIIGVLLLYALSVGPAYYFFVGCPRARPMIDEIYTPLWSVLQNTPMYDRLFSYMNWWFVLAERRYGEYHPEPSPATP